MDTCLLLYATKLWEGLGHSKWVHEWKQSPKTRAHENVLRLCFPAKTFSTNYRVRFQLLIIRSSGGIIIIPDINNSTLHSPFWLNKHFTSFPSCIYSQYFTLRILKVCKTDVFEWGFAQRTQFFLFSCCSGDGGGGEGARLKAEGKAPPIPPPHHPARKERVLKLLAFERTIPNTPFPLFVFLGAREHLKETFFIFRNTSRFSFTGPHLKPLCLLLKEAT